MADTKGKLVRQTNIPVVVGQPTPEQANSWLNQQIVYDNYAGKSDELDAAVKRHVSNHVNRFYQRMSDPIERWSTIWDAVNGDPFWGEFEDDIHVPESQKKFRSKITRIEEGLLDFDPIFEVEGTRGDLKQWKAQAIQAYVYRMMEIAGFRRLIQPAAGDMEICNVAAVKIAWQVTVGLTVDRQWERKDRENGTSYWHDERRIKETATTGLKFRQVDPFYFIYDIDCGDLESDECAYVGDLSNQFLHELEANKFYSKKNIAIVKERRAQGGMTASISADGTSDTWPDLQRRARSVAAPQDWLTDTAGETDPRKVRCIELWGWFDFGDGYDGVKDPLGRTVKGAQKVVITLAHGVPIQFRLNPLDKKCHPYAIGRINQNGHESVAPSNFEQVVQVNAQYDSHRSNVLRHASLSVAPMGTTQGEFPVGSLLGVKPGTIFPNVNEFKEIKISALPTDVPYMEGSFRRELEETSGVLNVFESPQGTATETERKVQEQQRMIRNSIRANGEMWRMAALKSYWFCAQFSTGPQRFAVSGKMSQILGKTWEITPDLLQEEVDVRFLGVDNMHVFGNRAAGLSQWSQRWGPMLPAMPQINMLGLAERDYELSVGRDHIHEIFPNQEPPWATWPQDDENEMLRAGLRVPVSTRDDDEQHLKDMEEDMEKLKDYPMSSRSAFLEHYELHVGQRDKKKEEQKARQQQAQQEIALMGGRPGVDKAPTPGGMEALTKAQEPGTTPGPDQARTVAKPGREGSGRSQSQSMSA